MFLPVKTNDVVSRNGVKYVVNSVQLTPDGPVLELYPIRRAPMVVHASEVSFAESGETVRRAKSVGVKAIEAQRNSSGYEGETEKGLVEAEGGSVVIPEGMTMEEAKAILKQFAR